MPPNEECPSCKAVVPDWHREWHTRPDQVQIFQGTAGMECPLCSAVVMHALWQTPLTLAPPGSQVGAVKRDVVQAAHWAAIGSGKLLADYLKTPEGSSFASLWSDAEIQQADQMVASTGGVP
jgi:hypothetical protein